MDISTLYLNDFVPVLGIFGAIFDNLGMFFLAYVYVKSLQNMEGIRMPPKLRSMV